MTITTDLPSAVTPPPERRRSARFKPVEPLEAIFGRGSGLLVDLSATGARIRHTAAVTRGARVRITFEWNGKRFEAVGEVLASRVARIGDGGTRFESRLRFLPLTRESSTVLEQVLAGISNHALRKWVANLHGWNEEDAAPPPAPPSAASTFVRCRFVNGHWEQRLTHQSTAPVDGFTVACGTDPSEIRALCRTWERSDPEGRRLLQLMTSAVLREVAG